MKQFKFNEDLVLEKLKKHIEDTYNPDNYYNKKGIQPNELILSLEQGEGFLIGNIIKYASRFGSKEGRNEKDLLKLLHYCVILMGNDIKKQANSSDKVELVAKPGPSPILLREITHPVGNSRPHYPSGPRSMLASETGTVKTSPSISKTNKEDL